MTTLRRFACSLAVLGFATTIPIAGAQLVEPPAPVGLSLTIVREHRPIQAVCVLVRREVRERDVVLYFVTAGHLFKGADGQPLPYPKSITVNASGQTGLVVRPADVSLPRGNLVDVAVLRVTVRETALMPPALTLEVPSVGDRFVVVGFELNGRPREVIQHVGRVATIALVGDHPLAATVAGCAGAPVLQARAVFGFVGKCGRDEPPLVVPFAAIASWIQRYVPGGLTLRRAMTTRFEYQESGQP